MLMTNDPRRIGREAVKNSIPQDLWEKNTNFSHTLLQAIQQHPIASHALIHALENGAFDARLVRYFHLEFHYAFAQIFTDGLLQAMFTSAQLEKRYGAIGKVSSRFLLQLNVLDELGFIPNAMDTNDYAGNPYLSHYVQFEQTLRQLHISKEAVDDFMPSQQAIACRATYEDHYHDHTLLSCLLAVSETVFSRFSGPWALSVGKATNIDVKQGYHSIHVEQDGKFIDDDHAEDSWYVFRQAILPVDYEAIQQRTIEWLDTWVKFLDHLMNPSEALCA